MRLERLTLLPGLYEYGEQAAALPVEPLSVICRTVTPVELTDQIALDAVLARAVVLDVLRVPSVQPSERPYWLPVPLAAERWLDGLPLWQSTDFVPVDPAVSSNHLHRRTEDNPFAMPALLSSLGGKVRRYPSSTAGQFINFRVPRRKVLASEWRAACVGNRAEVGRLLRYLTAFGGGRGRGSGVVAEWKVEEAGSFSFYDETGKPLRPIPTDEAIGVRQGWTPAYWRRDTWRVCLDSSVRQLIQ